MTKILSVDDVLAAPDLKTATIEVPEWGGAIKIQSFTKGQQQDIREQAKVNGELDSNRLEMLMLIAGIAEPKFTADRYEQLRQKAAGPVDRILGEILKLSGLAPGAVDEAKATFPA